MLLYASSKSMFVGGIEKLTSNSVDWGIDTCKEDLRSIGGANLLWLSHPPCLLVELRKALANALAATPSMWTLGNASIGALQINLHSSIVSSLDVALNNDHSRSISNHIPETRVFTDKAPPKIYVPTNPRGAESLPPAIVVSQFDFYLRRLWGEPSERAIHVSVRKQTKWWYAKRFLHPDIIAAYEYIFIWDEDLGVEHFNGDKYIQLMTKRRGDREVHKNTEEKTGWCGDPHLPPCAAFVEIMAPVFSREAWRCVWHMIQNDLVHGWGLDFALRRCVEPAHEKIGVVDSQWVGHQVIPSLGNQGQSENGKSPWQGMGEVSGLQLGVMGALFLSVASSVSIVICNKALMSFLGFPFATTLTSWHLMVTYCSLHVAQHFNFFESKAVDMNTVMLFGILNGVSIGFLNLSLGFNSIGFYQMTKLAIIPFTVLLETIFLKKQFSQKIKFSLFLLLVGVGIASITDLQLNFVGAILSLLAIITTCVGQILTNTIQKRLNVSSTQLLYQSAPFQAAILFVSGPWVDQCLTKQNVFAHKYSPIVLHILVIGKTSPVTYQVLGHLKTCLVLAFGYTLLHDPFTSRNIIGILIAILGMALYSYFCSHEKKKKQLVDLSPPSQIRDKETTALLVGMNGQEKESHEV
ncbi:UDP-xylose transporter 1 [Camellia lanceoleosa]|uniref:UDP-xylose transporter 1 n=1 Tax=Camellia lanceoleosa TaxID=1840588 RepID=A0ACC0FWC4_9ERIC|nr:UDP-xylose transporter 1 [Camellia lanceoleosa]